jgi:oligoendopeptidase F
MNDIKTHWDLKTYFYDSFQDPKYMNDKKNISLAISNFVSQYKGKISTISTSKEMLTFLKSEEDLDESLNSVLNYAYMRYYLNSEDEEIQKEIMNLDTLTTKLSEDLLFVQEELKKLGEKKLLRFSSMKELQKYQNYFYQIAVTLKYQLEDNVERALLQKSQSGVSSQLKLYEDLTSSYHYEFRGKNLSEEELLSKLEDVDENIRREAYIVLSKAYSIKERKITHGAIYTSVVKDSISSVKMRGFENSLHRQNVGEELTNTSVDTMLRVVDNNYSLFHTFLKIKAKLLGKENLDIWNIFAPIQTKKKEYEFKDACTIVLDSLKEFNNDAYIFSKEMIEKGRVDVMPKQGKAGGAFALYGKDQPSFVLLNYTKSISDISTLGHELGHAYHGHLSQTQNSHSFDSPLSLAETASIFNELILSEHIKSTLSKEEKIAFLVKELEETFGTIFKQVQYTLFEKKIHNTMMEGEEYTAKDYSRIWREESSKLNGETVSYYEKPDEETSWQRIPHIYRSPFYCYSYAFGNLLTYALYEKYLEEGSEVFLPKYLEILKSGGSKTPQDLLKPLGFDLESEEFYMLGINVLKKKIKELEKLM